MRRPAAALLAVTAAVLGWAGCGDSTVRLAFRPRPGDRSIYRVEVHAVAVTAVGGTEVRRTVADDVFEARHAVLEAGAGGTRVQVGLVGSGGEPLSFEVRLDRAAQLAEIQRIEGLPASALGELGLSEIFPAAAGAPPDRPLRPGDRWTIDEPVGIGSPGTARLVGQGRLAELGLVRGRKVATVESTFRLPVERRAHETEGLVLDGTQETSARATRALDDGAVEEAEARTRGRYRITLRPPAELAGPPLHGTLKVEVRSKTRRLR